MSSTFLLWSSALLVFNVVAGDITSILERYELLPEGSVTRRVIKNGTVAGASGNQGLDGATLSYNRIEEISFRALKRDFKLYLTPRYGLVAPNFQITIVEPSGRTRQAHPNIDGFYRGHIFGAGRSDVSAHFDPDGSLTASIEIDDETFIVEPAWRHIPDVADGVAIIYSASDVKMNYNAENEGREKCTSVNISPGGVPEESPVREHILSRSPRQSSDSFTRSRPTFFPKNRCGLNLVADYRFFQNIGNNQEDTTARYLIGLIGRVNQIFQRTIWRDRASEPGFSNMGFVIKNITVHTGYSKTKHGEEHYNMENSDNWNASKLLMVFSGIEGTPPDKYCLSHLFTYRSFANGILGLGYIAHPKRGKPGGICSDSMISERRAWGYMYPNTALSSGKSSYGRGAVITREADLVTAHEFGHNWGSPHDPDECSPRLPDGGPFIMYSYSVSGYDPNNEKFSPCSIRSIKSVLLAKSTICFEEASRSFCGNMLVESSEECDAGVIGHLGNDTCCTEGCNFRPGAVCSPKNSPCCADNCTFKSYGFVCQAASPMTCHRESLCSGFSAQCEEPPWQPNGTPCINGGECQNGTCVPYCSKRSIGLKPCMCETEKESCFRCCWNGTDCSPYVSEGMPGPQIMPAGTQCIVGVCTKQGKCNKQKRDAIEHIWAIIEKLDVNNFSKFLCDNMVATIILLSLVVWIPVCFVINGIDSRKKTERKQLHDWRRSENFVIDRNKVEVVRGIQHPSTMYPVPKHPQSNGANVSSI